MNHSTEYLVPNHDPILGVHDTNIASSISHDNWHNKAIVAGSPDDPLYVYIAPGEILRLRRKVYCATGYALNSQRIVWRHPFLTPDEAIAWINRHFG